MAVSDVYSAHFHMEMPSGPASVNFHFQETTEPSSTDGPDGVAGACMTQLVPLLRGIISAQCYVTMVRVYKRYLTTVAPAAASIANGVGLSPGNALPAQFAAKLGLQQVFFPQESNGMVWIPGLDEDRVTVSQLDSSYRTGPIQAFADQLLSDLEEPAAGDGRWRLIVLSRKWLAANPGDYPGASADVTGINKFLLVGRQKRRRTKVQGGAA